MNASDTEEQFFSILSSMLNVPRDQLDRKSSRDTVEQWDSLRHMHLVLALEEEFGIEFDDAEVAGLSAANDLLDSIVGKQVA